MIKRISVAVLSLFITCAAGYADWKVELTHLLAKKKDFQAAFHLLETNLSTMDDVDKPFGYLTLAYCGYKLLDKELENRWISDFFETYKGNTDLFPLTDYALNREIGNYLREWRKKYPLITQIGLIKDSAFNRSALPDHLTLGIEISNDTHYRLLYKKWAAPTPQDDTQSAEKIRGSENVHFSHTFSPGINKKEVAAGGLLREGFNFIEIPAARLFNESETHHYILDLKAGDLTVHKEIELNITCHRPDNSGQVKDKIRKSGYGVAMFIQNRLIAIHKKSVKHHRLSWEEKDRQKIRGDILTGRPPDPLGTEEKELQRVSFPVLSIPVSFFKRLIKPKLKEEPKKQIKTFNHLAATFLIKDSEGIEKPLDVTITFKLE